MKSSNRILFLMAFLWAMILTCLSQEVTTSSETNELYKFFGPQDSIPYSKTVINYHDSVFLQKSYTSFHWDNVEIDWMADSRTFSVFNVEGWLLKSWKAKWEQENDEWLNSDQSEYFYNENGLRTGYRKSEWSEEFQNWQLDYEEEFGYDSQGKLKFKRVDYVVYPAGFEQIYVYNSDGYMDTVFYHGWFEEDHDYKLDLYKYEFNESGKVTIRETCYNGSAVPATRVVDSCDEQGNLLEHTAFMYSEGSLIPQYRIEYGYDQWGYEILECRSDYNSTSEMWIGDYRNTDSLNVDGLSLSRAGYDWDDISGEWIGRYRTDHVYEAQGRAIIVNQFHWDLDSKGWFMYHYASSDYARMDCKQFTEVFDLNEDSSAFELTQHNWYKDGNYMHTTFDSICRGQEYLWQDEIFSNEAQVIRSYLSRYGNDSVYVLNLKANLLLPLRSIEGKSEVMVGEELVYVARGNPGIDLFWEVGKGTIVGYPGEDSLQVVWSGTGTGFIAAWLESPAGCVSDTSLLEVLIGPNQTADFSQSSVQLYPVPVKETLHLDGVTSDMVLSVIDLNGNIVYNGRGEHHQLGSLPPGTYIALLKELKGDLIMRRKIVISH